MTYNILIAQSLHSAAGENRWTLVEISGEEFFAQRGQTSCVVGTKVFIFGGARYVSITHRVNIASDIARYVTFVISGIFKRGGPGVRPPPKKKNSREREVAF